MRKIFSVILILFFLLVGIYGGYRIYCMHSERKESTDLYTGLDDLVSFPEDLPVDSGETPKSSESGETQGQPVVPEIDFDDLMKINDDCIGWIFIEGTEISYPVVQGPDNSYYLKHLFNGKWNSSGCIFLDARVSVDMSDRHSIIYGHHMKDGTMFSKLTRYKEQQYFDEHLKAFFITKEETYQVLFFAGYVAKVDDSAWKISFESDTDYEIWIKEIKARSWLNSELCPAVTDRIITLSTCSYEFNNARFVLHGILKPLAE